MADKCLTFQDTVLFLCIIFPEPFLRKKTRACPGNWEDSLRQSTRERWQFPCLPLPCLVFTSKTTEKAHMIYSDKEENGGPKGHLNKKLCNCGVAQQAGRGKQLFEGLLRGTLVTMTLSHRRRESPLMSFTWIFSKSSHPNMLMAVKSCPINLHIIGKSTLWNVKALLYYEILHKTSVVKTSGEVTAASGCWRNKSKFFGISRNIGNAPNSPSGTPLTG